MNYDLTDDNETLNALSWAQDWTPPHFTFSDNVIKTFAQTTKSKAERTWGQVGRHIIADEYEAEVLAELYEYWTFRIPGGKYTADFYYILESGRVVIVEVKGSRKQKNYRDARSKLRAAAAMNPWFTFVEAMAMKGGGFQLQEIKPDGSLLSVFINKLTEFGP